MPTEESEEAERFELSLITAEFKLPSKYTAEADARQDEEHQAFKDDLPYRQALFITKLVALWAIACGGLYAAGYGVGWVMRGFRHSGNSTS